MAMDRYLLFDAVFAEVMGITYCPKLAGAQCIASLLIGATGHYGVFKPSLFVYAQQYRQHTCYNTAYYNISVHSTLLCGEHRTFRAYGYVIYMDSKEGVIVLLAYMKH
jgi:hypothetical protein